MRTLITSGFNPDLDAVSASFGIAEMIKNEGGNAIVAFEGEAQIDASFYNEKLGISLRSIPDPDLFDEAILVDTSSIRYVPRVLRNHPERVVQVIDHRAFQSITRDFPSVRSFISQPIGACATIVTETMRQKGIDPTEITAIMLHGAISSSTLDLKASITTDRDKEIYQWLARQFSISPSLVREMWEHRSRLTTSDLKFTIINDIDRDIRVTRGTIGIAQIETLDGEVLIDQVKEQIFEILADIKEREGLDFIFLTIPSIQDEYNYLVTVDKPSSELLLEFMGDRISSVSEDESNPRHSIATTKAMWLRKEIKPLILEMDK